MELTSQEGSTLAFETRRAHNRVERGLDLVTDDPGFGDSVSGLVYDSNICISSSARTLRCGHAGTHLVLSTSRCIQEQAMYWLARHFREAPYRFAYRRPPTTWRPFRYEMILQVILTRSYCGFHVVVEVHLRSLRVGALHVGREHLSHPDLGTSAPCQQLIRIFFESLTLYWGIPMLVYLERRWGCMCQRITIMHANAEPYIRSGRSMAETAISILLPHVEGSVIFPRSWLEDHQAQPLIRPWPRRIAPSRPQVRSTCRS